MNKAEKVAISSLTVSIAAAALVFVSRTAMANDDPSYYCAIGSACTLGYTYDVYHQYDGSWWYEGGTWAIGMCNYTNACLCSGWVHQDHYVQDYNPAEPTHWYWRFWFTYSEWFSIPAGECFIEH